MLIIVTKDILIASVEPGLGEDQRLRHLGGLQRHPTPHHVGTFVYMALEPVFAMRESFRFRGKEKTDCNLRSLKILCLAGYGLQSKDYGLQVTL